MMRKFTLLITLFITLTLITLAQSNSGFSGGYSTNQVVKLYPNPATSQINLEILQNKNDQTYDVIIYDFLGKKFDEIKVSGRTTLNLDKYYSGIYIYQLRDSQGNVLESGKFNVIK
ncbi:MAG: T9SS type A sorting domain-containing protein [Chitinophagaceae bacterium]